MKSQLSEFLRDGTDGHGGLLFGNGGSEAGNGSDGAELAGLAPSVPLG